MTVEVLFTESLMHVELLWQQQHGFHSIVIAACTVGCESSGAQAQDIKCKVKWEVPNETGFLNMMRCLSLVREQLLYLHVFSAGVNVTPDWVFLRIQANSGALFRSPYLVPSPHFTLLILQTVCRRL